MLGLHETIDQTRLERGWKVQEQYLNDQGDNTKQHNGRRNS